MKEHLIEININLSIDQIFQGVNRLFVFSFEDENGRENNLLTVEIKDYNDMIDGTNFFNQPIKNDLRKHHYIRKIAFGQGDHYTTGCLLDYLCFKKNYTLITIDLREQQKLNADPKGIQQISFAGNSNWRKGATFFSFLKKRKKPF